MNVKNAYCEAAENKILGNANTTPQSTIPTEYLCKIKK
jgi:hypothetical protein